MAIQYVYYSTQRPVGIGTCPKKGLLDFHNYDKRVPIVGVGNVWGYLIYNRELDLHELCDYELKFAGEKRSYE